MDVVTIGRVVQSTHDVTIRADTVVKRYRSWDRGEPEREWRALSLLHRLSPGLAPEPLEQRIEAAAPCIVMTRLPGEPLGAAPLTPDQVTGLGRTLRRLHTTVPADELSSAPERREASVQLSARLRSWLREPHRDVGPTVGAALRAATSLVSSPEMGVLIASSQRTAFTHADGNLSNFLWDGQTCRIVDFEDSGVSDPAYEVADLLEHVSVWLPNLIDAQHLVEAVGFSKEHESHLAGFRRLFAVYWLLMLLPGNPAHARNPEGTVDRQARRLLKML